MASKKHPKPAWYKNTYFWIAAVLAVVSVIGLPFFGGEDAIRDPGQKRESGLVLLYVCGAIIMLVNGYMSHQQTVRAYHEAEGQSKD